MIGIYRQIDFIDSPVEDAGKIFKGDALETVQAIAVSLREYRKCIYETDTHVTVEMPYSTYKAYQEFLHCNDLPALLSAINTADMNNNSKIFEQFKQQVTVSQLETNQLLQEAFRWLQNNKATDNDIPEDIQDILEAIGL